MKKLLSIIFVMMLSSICVFAGCGNNDKNSNTIKLNEVTHSIFYAPLYVAINKGYIEEEGLKIKLTNGGGADKTMAAILSGDADIGLMGPEATIYCVQEGASDKPVVFGQLTKRDGSFLMGKTQSTNFDWNELINKEIIAGRRGGVPAMVLEYVLKEKGLKPGPELGANVNVLFNLDVQFNLVAAAFEGKNDAYCTMFEPTASFYQANNKGYILTSIGQASGEIPYTAFSTKSSYLKKNADKIEKFLRAVMKGYNFIQTNSLNEVAIALKPSFPDESIEALANAVNQYKIIDAWCETPVMKETALDKLQTIMLDAGALTHKSNFNEIVNNTIASKVASSFN